MATTNDTYAGWNQLVPDALTEVAAPQRRHQAPICPRCGGEPRFEEVTHHNDEPTEYEPCWLCKGKGSVAIELLKSFALALTDGQDAGAAARRARSDWEHETALPVNKRFRDPRTGRVVSR